MIARLLLLLIVPCICGAQTINVGSKRFTESYILGEILRQTMAEVGEARVVHSQGLGNTGIVFAALKSGSIDVYPDYTGTIAFELLGRKTPASLAELANDLRKEGLGVAVPLGFNNTYALATSDSVATQHGLIRISEMKAQRALRFGLSQEFLNRKDGWPAVKAAYGLPHVPRGLDHGLAYEALAAGHVDVIDVYSTDAKISRYALRLLEDDLGFFPRYDAVVIYRLDFAQRFPKSWSALQALEGALSAKRMAALNAEVELGGRTFAAVAQDFVEARSGRQAAASGESGSFAGVLFGPDLLRLTLEHLALVLASLLPALVVGIPLGVWAAYSRRASHWIMAAVGLLQTVPALALLAFLITAMGRIGVAPAIAALFLYALLPIVRNTASGLTDLPLQLQESARALGLPWLARLRRVELPLASRSILAGAKTSAVIAVGTATIAAFIGAGGYGERIVAGLAVNVSSLLLAGALPAAALALLVQW
ncbi:MAG: glycine betaine ABC transporter substrate-binding protein, partial [Burkholderiales bacterium]